MRRKLRAVASTMVETGPHFLDLRPDACECASECSCRFLSLDCGGVSACGARSTGLDEGLLGLSVHRSYAIVGSKQQFFKACLLLQQKKQALGQHADFDVGLIDALRF